MEVDTMRSISEETADEDAPSNDFLPRLYQVHLEEKSMNRNSIIHLPTGSGKTFIAIQLIKRMKKDLMLPWGQGGKKSVFLVNTVPLVDQQRQTINALAPVKAVGYSSEDKVDLWNKAKWDHELAQYNVLVMTSQILSDMLQHRFIRLEDLNLIIFDECHHAVDDHPMRQIMKMFEQCPKDEQPKVLGLTATLLNANVKLNSIVGAIEKLETTFHGTIATVNDWGEVLTYSTNPRELISEYSSFHPSHEAKRAIQKLSSLELTILATKLPNSQNDPSIKLKPGQKNFTKDPQDINKKVRNMVVDMQKLILSLGMYGGSLGITAYTILLERIKRRTDNKDECLLYKYVIIHANMAKKILEDAMSGSHGYAKIIKYSSEHVIKLLDILKEFDERRFSSNEPLTINIFKKKLSAIIFVQQRFTAKILYNVLKAVKEANPLEFEFLRHDFVVGFNINPYKNTREQFLDKKYSVSALLRFKNEDINCLISTSVIEEGVDIPQCSLVVRYDPPKEYRSYIQSKGRARYCTSNYVIQVERSEQEKFGNLYLTFQKTEQLIQNLLIGKTDIRQEPTDRKIQRELYSDEDVPPFIIPSGVRITDTYAIRLLNQYCSLIPQDRFTQITPNWIHEKLDYGFDGFKSQVTIVMPIGCPVKEPIKGLPMESLKAAKRSAALNTCVKLYEAGELDQETALPKRFGKVNFEEEDVKSIFQNWEAELEGDEAKGLGYPGTKKRIRKHDKAYPKCFQGVPTWKFGHQTFHMHVIHFSVIFEKPKDTRDLALYNLLKMEEGYAFLTSHPLPKLCDFPMFLSIGEVQISLMVNHDTVLLNKEKFDEVKEFHHLVFHQVLDIAKSFVVFDGVKNSAYVVPVSCTQGSKYGVDWDVISRHKSIAPIVIPADEARRRITVDSSYKYSVVTPWYRGSVIPDRYIVSNILEHMSPMSQFSSDNSCTYEEYYVSRYNLPLLGPHNQPLLEVRNISSRMNCLLPRAPTLHTLYGKQLRLALAAQGEGKSFKESFVPEFCIKYDFPGVLWYKATVLPSILHRVSMILVANDLRLDILQATRLGTKILPQGEQWKPLTVDPRIATDSLLSLCGDQRPDHNSINSIQTPLYRDDEASASTVKIASMKDTIYKLQMSKLASDYPWDEKKEPIDIERNIASVTLMDIECYDEFVMTPVTEVKVNSGPSGAKRTAGPAICPAPPREDAKISVLSQKQSIRGIELRDLVTVLTLNRSNDAFNLERLETLGDSFLKFVATLYLFHKFQKHNEGQLTNIKSRLIGNRNLFYAGKRIGLGGRIKSEHFSPREDYVMTSFAVPQPVINFIESASIRPTFLIGLELTREEQLSGELESGSMAKLNRRFLDGGGPVEEETPGNIQYSMQCYLHKEALSDKSVADCVEALVGAYMVSDGLVGGVRILEYLRVLPAEDNFESYLTKRVPTVLTEEKATRQAIEFLLEPNREEIEGIIGYRFKDASFLLEALSHPSFIKNRLTNSYERLEFLGDAILDFLITSYLFENNPMLKPGELTDLRSALVNNVTFASYVVKLGLHKYLLSTLNPKLDNAILTFVEHQEQRGHCISEDVLYLIDEEDCHLAQYIEVPKVLSDIYESLAGAIFLDSGGDLQLVWKIYYRIMCREIDAFSKAIPIQPVRLLLERVHAGPHFGSAQLVAKDRPEIMVPVTVTVNGRKLTVHGFGSNKAEARRAAAKIALKNLEIASMASTQVLNRNIIVQ